MLKDLKMHKFAVFDFNNSRKDKEKNNAVGLYFDADATTKDMLKGYLISMHYINSLETSCDNNNSVKLDKQLLEHSHLYGDKMIDDYIATLETNGWNAEHVFFDEKNMGRLTFYRT